MNEPVFDLIGIGFGPAGIATAIQLEEFGVFNNKRIVFLEKNSSSTWQENFLLPGTIINHHPSKDLVSSITPTSKYSFHNYLKQCDRFFEFGHLDGIVYRSEWSDYIRWASQSFKENVKYNTTVLSIEPCWDVLTENIIYLKVVTNDAVLYTKNIILCNGLKPFIPDLFKKQIGPTCFHTNDYLSRLSKIEDIQNKQFLVVGSGQSAAEVLIHLRSIFAPSKLYSISRKTGFKLKESGHFSNFIYFPDEIDYFYNLDKKSKDVLLKENSNVDYGTINKLTSQELFRLYYQDLIINKQCFHLFNRSKIIEFTYNIKTKKHDVLIEDIYKKSQHKISVDLVVVSTGYYQEEFPSILKEFEKYIEFDESAPIIMRDYRVKQKKELQTNIYLCGLSETTFGMNDTQSFSLMAEKAHTIAKSIYNII